MEIHIDDLIIPNNRQRQEFSQASIAELAQSILSKGLLHAVVVRDDGRTLVAGERRIRAMDHIHCSDRSFVYHGVRVDPMHIPVVPLGALSPEALEEAELEENVLRVDLTMQERVKARARLHELRVLQDPSHTIKDTAQEIVKNGSTTNEQRKVSQAVTLARWMDDPDVAKAKDENEAEKIIRKKLQRDIQVALSEQHEEAPKTPHSLLCGDAVSLMNNLAGGMQAGTFDVIITDPPYGIGANTFGDQSSTTHEYKDDEDYAVSCHQTLFAAGFELAAPQAHLYLFCDPRWFRAWENDARSAGWDVWPTPLIWYKGNQGILPRPDFGPRRTYEFILFASKGNKPVTKVGMSDVILLPNTTEEKLHAAQKPVVVYVDLLSRSCVAGNNILDPFCGCGTVFPAANELSLIATGIEQNEFTYATALNRISGVE